MALRNQATSKVALGVVPLGLYLVALVAALIGLAPSFPSVWIYLLTGVPLVAFVGYRVLQGRTYELWDNVALLVVSVSVLLVVLPWAPAAAGLPPNDVPLTYYLFTGAPILGYVGLRLAFRPT